MTLEHFLGPLGISIAMEVTFYDIQNIGNFCRTAGAKPPATSLRSTRQCAECERFLGTAAGRLRVSAVVKIEKKQRRGKFAKHFQTIASKKGPLSPFVHF